ncbi:MAG: TIGR03564 family F420-dependent LLM class oxidoreductase [Actinobacteria bacterium]|nr:TIGR03564 family F420-dependent LLM class oxidoreductase [Actinomycetota bacterium]
MRIGIFGGDVTAGNDIEMVTAAAAAAQAQGFASFAIPQIFGADALTVLAVIATKVPDIELGTGVVPTYPRHPVSLAAQALTVQAVSGNRLMLGIGLSHQMVIEGIFGLSYDKPVRHMREYLSILMPLLRDESADFDGETLHAHVGVTVPGAEAPTVLIAALGSQMLKLAGTLADGTVTWMTGPATIAEHTAPAINAAAQEAGRPAPRVAVALPVCVTHDEQAARGAAAATFEVYGFLPSYRAMLDREGAAGPADVAIVGDEATVRAGIERVRDAGATDFVASEYGSRADRARTRDLLRSML